MIPPTKTRYVLILHTVHQFRYIGSVTLGLRRRGIEPRPHFVHTLLCSREGIRGTLSRDGKLVGFDALRPFLISLPYTYTLQTASLSPPKKKDVLICCYNTV